MTKQDSAAQEAEAFRHGMEFKAAQPEAPEASEPKKESVVVVAFHGMGEHLPMAALQDALVQLKGALGEEMIEYEPNSFVSTGQRYTQVQIHTNTRSFRVTEAYYSPYFKGLTNVSDVLGFLALAAWKSITGEEALRRSFGKKVMEFPPAKGTKAALVLALSIVLSLLYMNGFFAAAGAQMLMGGGPPALPKLAAAAGMFLVVAVGVLLGAMLAACAKRPTPRRANAAFSVFLLLCCSLPFSAVVLLASHLPLMHSLLPLVPEMDSFWFWAAGLIFAGGSVFVRRFFDGYVGDVTAYIGGYGSSKFFQARRDVAERVDRTMQAVTHGGCDHLIVLSHSLGTVVAYDALNRFLLPQGRPETEDPKQGFANNGPKVKRISLITYGSPLDKIAYLFRSESGSADDLRNDLISSQQPLTQLPLGNKPFRWINIYAKHDIVAGSLEYFDARLAFQVENRLDEDNMVPLACHSQYSLHKEIQTALRDVL